tara:strand:+ start:973 stop:5436 length:4464 start_codon:yes stop_codon:yes gene_type:complete
MSYSKKQQSNPLQQMQQEAQQNPFGSGKYNEMGDIQNAMKAPPQTTILECNRFTSRQDDETAEQYSTNHRWTTEFASGIQIRANDEIRINSGFISSIGVGDLIAWDGLDGSATQDNLANWIYSVYVCNDGLNDKRESYNIKDGGVANGGIGRFPYDTDNSACPLMRVVRTNTLGVDRTEQGQPTAQKTFSYNQDPYLPCRFFGEKYAMNCPNIDNHFLFVLSPNYINSATNVKYGTTILCKTFSANDTLTDVQASSIFSVGQTINFIPQQEERNTANWYEYQHNTQKWTFTCYGFIEDENNTQMMIVDNIGDKILLHNQPTNGIPITARCKISNLPASCADNEGLPPYATKIYDDDDDTYIDNGDVLYGYNFNGMDNRDNDYDKEQVISVVSDNQTGNKPLRMTVAQSLGNKIDTRQSITILLLENPDTTLNARERQQYIKFKNPLPSVITNLLSLVNYAGSNVLIFDIYNPYTFNKREKINVFLTDESISANPINYEITKEYITITGCVKRECNLQQTNLTTAGQQITKNLIPNNLEDNYLIKTGFFFQDIQLSYGGKTDQQFQSLSYDYSTGTLAPEYALKYYTYIRIKNENLNNTAFVVSNDRERTGSINFQSSIINLINPNNNNSVLNARILYNGDSAVAEDTSNVKHYQQFQFKIDEDYSSPSDIATALTTQTHKITNIRNKLGIEIPNSKGIGLINNSFFFPVWTSNNDDNLEQVDGTTPNTTGLMLGKKAVGSFFLSYRMKNGSVNVFNIIDYPPVDENCEIYFRTHHTSINKPTVSQIAGGAATLTLDFNQYNGKDGNGALIAPAVEYAKCFEKDGTTISGYPIKYAHDNNSPPIDCLVSQYAGSNNVVIEWDDTNSRFNINYLHQPSMSKFEATSAGIVQSGDTISATIYFPAPIGNNNVLYKLPRTRISGINIENWTSNYFQYPSTPYQVRELANVPLATNLNDEWFIIRKQDILRTEQLNYDPISFRFWTKLGFSQDQLYKTFVGSEFDSNNRYVPLGTTDNLVDIADSLITTKEPSENTPFFGTSEVFDTGSAREAKYEFSSIGALEFNNHFTGCGLPNTSGQPLSFRPNEATDLTKFSAYNSSYNPDRERCNGYTFTTEGDPIVAKSLPIKTEFPYFLVMSDLVSTDFNVSANGGSSLNCVGVISKLNAEQDFYFQYQAPQSFYATKDSIISSITTEIRTPALGIPPALSPYSSIIYQIVRYSPTPIISEPPIWFKQEQFYNQMNTLLNTINGSNQSGQSRFSSIMNEIADAVVKPQPENASIIQRIISNYDQLNLKQFKNNPSGLRNFLIKNPEAESFMRDIRAFNNIPSVGQQQQQIPVVQDNTPEPATDQDDYLSTPINEIQIPPDDEDNMRWLLNHMNSTRPVDKKDFIDRYAFENKDAEDKVGVELKTYKDKPKENATIVDMMRDKKAVFGSDVSSNLSVASNETTPLDRISELEELKKQSDSGIGSSKVSSRQGKTPTYSSGLSSITE